MRTAFTAMLAVLCAAPLAAQKQPPPVQESATVTVVEVPVHVLGKDGKPLAGLTEADFELFDDGQRQTITALDVVDLRRVAGGPGQAPAPAGPEAAAARRHWLLLFDLSFSQEVSITRAVSAASRFVSKGLSPGDFVAVASTSVDGG